MNREPRAALLVRLVLAYHPYMTRKQACEYVIKDLNLTAPKTYKKRKRK